MPVENRDDLDNGTIENRIRVLENSAGLLSLYLQYKLPATGMKTQHMSFLMRLGNLKRESETLLMAALSRTFQ